MQPLKSVSQANDASQRWSLTAAVLLRHNATPPPPLPESSVQSSLLVTRNEICTATCEKRGREEPLWEGGWANENFFQLFSCQRQNWSGANVCVKAVGDSSVVRGRTGSQSVSHAVIHSEGEKERFRLDRSDRFLWEWPPRDGLWRTLRKEEGRKEGSANAL